MHPLFSTLFAFGFIAFAHSFSDDASSNPSSADLVLDDHDSLSDGAISESEPPFNNALLASVPSAPSPDSDLFNEHASWNSVPSDAEISLNSNDFPTLVPGQTGLGSGSLYPEDISDAYSPEGVDDNHGDQVLTSNDCPLPSSVSPSRRIRARADLCHQGIPFEIPTDIEALLERDKQKWCGTIPVIAGIPALLFGNIPVCQIDGRPVGSEDAIPGTSEMITPVELGGLPLVGFFNIPLCEREFDQYVVLFPPPPPPASLALVPALRVRRTSRLIFHNRSHS